MEAGGAALPELYEVRLHHVATPMWWAGYLLVLVLGFQLVVGGFQDIAGGDGTTLGGSPSAYPAAHRARVEVGIAFLSGELFNGAFYTYLALQLLPEEEEGDVGVGSYFAALGALIVGEEGEAPIINALKEDNAGMWPAIGAGRGEGHGIDFGDSGGDGLVEPMAEEAHGIGTGSLLIEGGEHVVLAYTSNIAAVMGHLFVFTIVGGACVFEAYVQELYR